MQNVAFINVVNLKYKIVLDHPSYLQNKLYKCGADNEFTVQHASNTSGVIHSHSSGGLCECVLIDFLNEYFLYTCTNVTELTFSNTSNSIQWVNSEIHILGL